MARRGGEGSFCARGCSRKSRGDYYSDVDERRSPGQQPECYAEPLNPPKNAGQRLAPGRPKPENRGARNRYERMLKTEAPYLSYWAQAETDQNTDKKGGRDGSVVVSESSYYGDTSVEAVSVICKAPPLKSNGAKKNNERGACKGDGTYKEVDELGPSEVSQKAKNGAGAKDGGRPNGKAPGSTFAAAGRVLNGRRHSAPESDVLASGVTQPKAVPQRGNHSRDKAVDPARTLRRPLEDKPLGGPFGDEQGLEGLVPADASLAAWEKDARPLFALSEDIVQVRSESSTVGAPAPGPRNKSSEKGHSIIAVVNGTERSNAMAERSAAAHDFFIERRTAEQERNGQKVLPAVEEPVVVPAVAEMSTEIKAHPQRSERTVVKSQAVVTGERYPLGSDSYYARDVGMTAKSGRYRRHSDDSPVAEVHEGFDVTDDELKGLLGSKKRSAGGRRNGGTNGRKSERKAIQPQSGAGGGRTQRRFVFKRQQQMNHSGGADVGEDDEFDASYKTASGKHSWSMEGTSGNYVSAEPHDATEQVWSRRRDCSNIEKHWGAEYSDAESDETIGPGQSWLQEVCSEEMFRTANSRSTDENEGPGKCHSAHQMGYGGGRFVQESAEVRRKFTSDAGPDGGIEESSFGDESPSLAKESQSWSIVSSEENLEGVDRHRWVTMSENEDYVGNLIPDEKVRSKKNAWTGRHTVLFERRIARARAAPEQTGQHEARGPSSARGSACERATSFLIASVLVFDAKLARFLTTARLCSYSLPLGRGHLATQRIHASRQELPHCSLRGRLRLRGRRLQPGRPGVRRTRPVGSMLLSGRPQDVLEEVLFHEPGQGVSRVCGRGKVHLRRWRQGQHWKDYGYC
ncbi:hypothetical protein V5799_010202 [Amblyomma americanum]|uniref:Uncharacterized protein n=1 Tax=Amblyomma americanum TaxID=6943 RepID=A0AAQ4F9U3_AMBAM